MASVQQRLHRPRRLEALGSLTGGITHDFNNVLGAILGYGEMALRDAPMGSRLRRNIDGVLTAAEHGRDLVDSILAFTRGGAGERVAVDVQQIVQETLRLIEGALPQDISIDAKLRAARAVTRGDPMQLRRVLMNLAANAVQAMQSGGTLRVSLDALHFDRPRTVVAGRVPSGDYLVLQVADDGAGIPDAMVKKIFEPFFTTKDEGTGLGLALVRGIVCDMGGALDVSSRLGGGSVFTVYLPSAADDAAFQPKVKLNASTAGSRNSISNVRSTIGFG